MNINNIIFLIFIICSLIISFLDIFTYHISLAVNYVGYSLSLGVYIYFSFINSSYDIMINHLTGSFCLFLVFLLVRILSHNGLGWGDLHYSLFCGLSAGVPGFIASSLLSAVLGIICFLILKIHRKDKEIKNIRIPFIPFMFSGTITVMILQTAGLKFC